jgi:hypothetical protein
VPVRTMFDYLEDGETLERFFWRDFPQFLGNLPFKLWKKRKNCCSLEYKCGFSLMNVLMKSSAICFRGMTAKPRVTPNYQD